METPKYKIGDIVVTSSTNSIDDYAQAKIIAANLGRKDEWWYLAEFSEGSDYRETFEESAIFCKL